MATSTPRTFASKVYAEHAFTLRGLEGISDAQIQEHLTLYAGYVSADDKGKEVEVPWLDSRG